MPTLSAHGSHVTCPVMPLRGRPPERLAALARLAERWRGELAARGLAAPRGAGLVELVELDLRAAQALPYASDPPGPVDLVSLSLACVERDGGDCEERAAYLAARLTARVELARVDVDLGWIPQEWAPLDHVTVRVRLPGRAWQWADPTVAGARLGEHPWTAARRLRRSEV